MSVDSVITLVEAVGMYVGTLTNDERTIHQRELNRFVMYFGARTAANRIIAAEVESYQEQVHQSGVDPAARLEPVKGFLTFAHNKKITSINLAKVLKTRRAASKHNAQKQKTEADLVEMTAEGFDRLKQELEHLKTNVRREIAGELYEARLDKDIRENAPYDAAKNRQAEIEARIRYLEQNLAKAKIIDQLQTNSEHAVIGAKVLMLDLTHGGQLDYTLVGASEANPRAGKLSVASPVGKALLGRRVGEEFLVEAPAGVIRYRVERIGY